MKAHLDADDNNRGKSGLVSDPASVKHHKSDLLASWRRSQLALGSPERITDVPQVPQDDLNDYLLEMLQDPLDHFADSLNDTGLGLLLADARGGILHRWTSDSNASAHFNKVGTLPRSNLAEEAVGTNGVGTTIATGKPVQIHSSEHFAEFYREAICTGMPVTHPITGRIMGAVTLSTGLTPRSDLLLPLISSLSVRLERHLLELAQPTTRRMFDLFLQLSRRSLDPIVAIGAEDIYITSTSAANLNAQDKTELIRLSSSDLPSGRYPVELSTGPMQVEITAFGEGNYVIALREAAPSASRLPASKPLPLTGRSPEWLALITQVAKLRDTKAIALIVGEPGVGKTSLGLGFPTGPGDIKEGGSVIDAATSHLIGDREWLQRVSRRLKLPELLVIKGVGTLSKPVLDGLRSLLENSEDRGPVFLTLTANSLAEAEELKRHFGVGALWLPPLRQRFTDIAALWHAIALDSHPGKALALSAATIEVFRAHPWHGNARELRSLMGQLAAADRPGPVVLEHLPADMQPGGSHTRLERVEIEAISTALREADGNRVKAAEVLGISRATIYRKMKAYKLVP